VLTFINTFVYLKELITIKSNNNDNNIICIKA